MAINIRAILAAIILSGIAPGALHSQTAVSPPPKTQTAKPSAVSAVESWTKKQWEAAKKEWTKDTKKWADCNKSAQKQKLEGRKSWSFIYSCMTK